MTEYVPCLLKRSIDTTMHCYKVVGSGEGYCHVLKSTLCYVEELIPCEMDELVSVMQGKRVLLPGPFRLPQVPGWAKTWFNRKETAD